MLLDINMPELSGFEVLAALKSDGFDFDACPVLILTNSSNAEHRTMADSYGADYMIKAELTPREVLEHINSRLGIAGS
jgi:DNA-binding response OmpR family regulator